MLDNNQLQEWPLSRIRAVSEEIILGGASFLDVEGRNANNAWTLANRCLLRLSGDATHVVRRHVACLGY